MGALETELTSQLIAIAKATGILSVGIYLFMRTLHAWKWVAKSAFYARIAPGLPPALGITGAFFGGVAFDKQPSLVLVVIYGLVAAYGAEKFQKILGQSILGLDKRINGGKK